MKDFLQNMAMAFKQTITRSFLAVFLSSIALLSQVSFAATNSASDFNEHISIASGTINPNPTAIIPTDFSIRFNIGGNTRRGGSSIYYKKRPGRFSTHRDRRFSNNHRSYNRHGRPIHRDHRGRSKRSFGYVDRYIRYR